MHLFAAEISPLGFERRARAAAPTAAERGIRSLDPTAADADFVERVMPATDLPAILLEWCFTIGTPRATIEWRLADGWLPVPVHARSAPAPAPQPLLVGHSAAGTLLLWTDRFERTGVHRVETKPGEDGRVRAVVWLAAPGEPVDVVPAGLRDRDRLARAALAGARRVAKDQLTVETDPAGIGEAVEWAKHRLARERIGSAWAAVGALAAGDARRAADWLASDGVASLEAAASRRAAPGATAVLLAAARHHAWTGVAGFTAANRVLLRDAALCLAAAAEVALQRPPDAAFLAPALTELATALQDAGDAAAAAALLGAVRRLRARAFPDDPATDPPNTFDDANPEDAPFFLAGFVHHLLGVAPDAPRHRVTIAPRPPAGLRSIAVRSLRLGDALLSLHLTRGDRTMLYHLEQKAGAVPLRVVLEAWLPRSPSEVRLDGERWDLEERSAGGGVVVAVQFELDEARRIELDGT